tara:strand:- start:1128 stop:1928 length:801 start_codon:yes stop_codon:yes gene_type:complete
MIKKTKELKSHILSQFDDSYDRVRYLKNKYEGETAYVLGAGPSLSYYEKDFLVDFLSDKLVLSMKQTYNLVGEVTDFHFVNFSNLNQYKNINSDTITIWSVWDATQPYTIINNFNHDIILDTYKFNDGSANLDNSMAFVRDFDKLDFDSSFARPWGPGTMYEMCIPLSLYLGCKKIVTLGWDMYGNKLDELKKMEDENKGITHDYFDGHDLEYKETIPKVSAKEIFGVIDSTEDLNKWLKNRGVDLEIVDPYDNNPAHKSIKRIKL